MAELTTTEVKTILQNPINREAVRICINATVASNGTANTSGGGGAGGTGNSGNGGSGYWLAKIRKSG